MTMEKVLFFKPGAIGDTLQALPALKALRRSYPSAHVTAVVSPGLQSLLQGSPDIDTVLVFDKSRLKNNVAELIGFGARLRTERYDLFVDLQPSLRSFILRRICGAKRTLVYRKEKRIKPGGKRMHAVENFLETLAPLGIAGPADDISLTIGPEPTAEAGRFLQERNLGGENPLIALNCGVGAARPARNWFPERFAELADRLTDELHAGVVFIGGPEDRDLVQGVIGTMRNRAHGAAGVLSLAATAALLARCSCLVSSDTGPLHLATAVGTPVVGLYGSTDPRRTGPFGRGHQVLIEGLPCVPCEEKHCPRDTRECMEALTVHRVFAAVRKAMAC